MERAGLSPLIHQQSTQHAPRLHSFSLDGRPGVWTPWFSPDEKKVYAVRGDTCVHVLNLSSDSEEEVIRLDPEAGENDLRCATMDASRSCVFGGMADGCVRQWNLSGGAQLRTFSGHESSITAVVLSPDGRRLASASEDGTARVFDVATGNQLALCKAGATVTAVAFLGGSNRIVTGDADGLVAVWDARGPAAHRIALFKGHTDAVLSIDVDASQALLAAGSADKTATVWSLPMSLRQGLRRP